MRRIVCRFDNTHKFLDHFDTADQTASLTFFSDQPLPCNEVLQVTLLVTDAGERHQLHMQIDEKTPTLSPDTGDVRWHYDASVVDEDAPWLEMLIAKLTTTRRVHRTAS